MIAANQQTNRFFDAETMQKLLEERKAVEKEVADRPGVALLAALAIGLLIGIGIKRL
jgi:hypothetical protein